VVAVLDVVVWPVVLAVAVSPERLEPEPEPQPASIPTLAASASAHRARELSRARRIAPRFSAPKRC
jgi:hypothetical protein